MNDINIIGRKQIKFKSRGTFYCVSNESGDRLFFLFSLRSFENKNIIFAWLYCLAKIMLKRVSKGIFPLHTVIGFANSVVCYHFDKMVFYHEL